MRRKSKDVKKLLKALVSVAKRLFEKNLIACYLIDNMTDKGLENNISHITVCLILKDPYDEFKYETLIEQLNQKIIETGLPFADCISLQSTSLSILESTSGYRRLSSFEKLDLIEKGKCLFGKDILHKLTTPNELDMAIEGVSAFLNINDIDDVIHDIQQLPKLVKEGRIKKITNLILWPARFIYTAQTNHLGRNLTAVEHFLKHCQELDKVNLIKWAYAVKQLPSGGSMRDTMKEFVSLGTPVDSLMSLYANFLTLYKQKLQGKKNPELDKKIDIALKKLDSTR